MCLVHAAGPTLLELVGLQHFTHLLVSLKPQLRPYAKSDTRTGPYPARPAVSIAAGYPLIASSYLRTAPDVGLECPGGVWCSEVTYAPRPGLAQSPDSFSIHRDTIFRPMWPRPLVR